jgi:DNA invertase Pin-like site-specific DNA recombinase
VIAAIYARKSTEQNVPDDAKSVTRQVELARAFAASKGWRVADEHVYIDDAVSGAEYVKRPATSA